MCSICRCLLSIQAFQRVLRKNCQLLILGDFSLVLIYWIVEGSQNLTKIIEPWKQSPKQIQWGQIRAVAGSEVPCLSADDSSTKVIFHPAEDFQSSVGRGPISFKPLSLPFMHSHGAFQNIGKMSVYWSAVIINVFYVNKGKWSDNPTTHSRPCDSFRGIKLFLTHFVMFRGFT